jgi:hypothetical protein
MDPQGEGQDTTFLDKITLSIVVKEDTISVNKYHFLEEGLIMMIH